MECQCERDTSGDGAPDWWQNNFQIGAFTVVGYLLYRFSQTLPALIRWPIRIFCSLTGLSALWSWVSRLVRTIRGIRSLFKFLARMWRFIAGSEVSSKPSEPGLRLIFLGPTGRGRTSLINTLLDNTETHSPTCPLEESTKLMTRVDGRKLTVVDTADLLGSTLGPDQRAREALRSLQLIGPGPHAFLLLLQSPDSKWDASRAVRATLELFGDEAAGYVVPVLLHERRKGGRLTVDQLLDADGGDLRRAVSLCGQRPELVDVGPEAQEAATRTQLLERVMRTEELRGQFIHELQRREDRVREELLADMASALARKLGHI